MQKRSLTATWESQLRSYESELSPDRPRSPKHAHLPQSSSPSFLEAYAKYVEQQRESDPSRDSSGSSHRQSQGIRAFSGSQTARSYDKTSPDARRDTSDSGYSSWPGALVTKPPPALPCVCALSLDAVSQQEMFAAKLWSSVTWSCCVILRPCCPPAASASTGSPGRPVPLARHPGQSAESLPSPSSHSPSRFRRSMDVQPRSEEGAPSLRKEQPTARVSVAAAVDALEGRCRWCC